MRFVVALAAWLPRALIMLAAIGLLNFAMIRLAPGDPAAVIAGESGAGDATVIAQIRKDYGLDRPILVQVSSYLGRLAVLDLGVSYRNNRSVATLIGERIPATLMLTGTALAIAILVGTTLGIASAQSRGGLADMLIGSTAMLFYAMPVFWVGLVLVLIFSVGLGWLPAFGMTSLIPKHGMARAVDVLHHLILPALSLALLYLAVYVRLSRAATLEVLDREFVRTAHAKGLTNGQVLRRHVLRNVLLPTITMAGLQIGQLVGGAVVVETVFAWPGIGRLAFDALLQRDYAVVLGVFFVSSIVVVFANLATDIAMRIVDPRIGR